MAFHKFSPLSQLLIKVTNLPLSLISPSTNLCQVSISRSVQSTSRVRHRIGIESNHQMLHSSNSHRCVLLVLWKKRASQMGQKIKVRISKITSQITKVVISVHWSREEGIEETHRLYFLKRIELEGPALVRKEEETQIWVERIMFNLRV